jgi:capsular exopolysaccharide synthesis family protein
MQISKNKITEDPEDNFLKQFASTYLPYWPLFLLAILIAIASAYTYIHYATPMYEATATVIIKDEKKGNEESKLVESLDQISSKKIVENEIEIIQSRKLMEDVVRNLGLYAPIYEKGDVHNILAYTSSPISVTALYPDSLHYYKGIDLNYDAKSKVVVLDHRYTYPLDTLVNTPFGKLKFVPNPYFGSDTANKQLYFSLNQPKDVVTAFLSGLKAEAASKESSIVDLNYVDTDPVRAENILNQLIKSYQESANEEKDALARNTLSFVNNRLQIVSRDLDSIEKKVEQFKSNNRAVDINTQGQLYLQNVSTNNQKLGDVNTQLAVLDKVQEFVNSNSDSKAGIVPSTLGISDPQLNDLIQKLYNSQLEYDNLKKTVGENNPSLVAIRDRINKIKPSILSNITSMRQSLIATRDNISATNNNYNSVLQAVPEKERELLVISREQQIKSDLYSFLLQKKEESEIAAASSASNSKVVDYAQASPDPVSPKKILIYPLAVLLFVGICGTIIFIREFLTGKVLYRHEIESLTSIPILGEIAFDKSKDKIVIEKGTRSFVAEEFRKLRISLSFLGIDTSHKKVLVTSSISGEGKSFISANLATSISLTNKKVVLVDMDLNNPTLDKILGVDREEGVTEFLEGEKDPEEIIKLVEGNENLFFISAGAILPENPSELLSNGRVAELLDYLDNIFDLIIVDTSPMVLVTDGYLLTRLCDATLYVIRHGFTPKMLIKRIDQNIHINPINNPAIVFNGVKMRGFFKNNYGYGYDYVYGDKTQKKHRRTGAAKY